MGKDPQFDARHGGEYGGNHMRTQKPSCAGQGDERRDRRLFGGFRGSRCLAYVSLSGRFAFACLGTARGRPCRRDAAALPSFIPRLRPPPLFREYPQTRQPDKWSLGAAAAQFAGGGQRQAARLPPAPPAPQPRNACPEYIG